MFSSGEPRRRTGLRTVFQGRGAQSARTRLDGSCGAPRDGGPYQISWSENRYAVRKITPCRQAPWSCTTEESEYRHRHLLRAHRERHAVAARLWAAMNMD